MNTKLSEQTRPAYVADSLESAYRATSYRIFTPNDPIDLRIGEASPALAAFLQQRALASEGEGSRRITSTMTILTAYNPHSILQTDAENARCQKRLEDYLYLRANHDLILPGVNLADSGHWPPEKSVAVFNMDEAAALQCAATFGQNAFVMLGTKEIPASTPGATLRLIWVPHAPKPSGSGRDMHTIDTHKNQR